MLNLFYVKYFIKYLKIKKNSIKENHNLGIHSFIMNSNNNRKNKVIIYYIYLQFVSFEFIHNFIF